MLASILSDTYGYKISFVDWFMIGLPIVVILTPIVWLFLTKFLFKVSFTKSDALENTLLKMKKKLENQV